VIGHYQPDESVEMIAMQMADKDVIDLTKAYIVFPELHLGAFAAVAEKQAVLMVDKLGCWMPAWNWCGRIAAKYGYRKVHSLLL
jgi:hypothetical protein